MTAPGRASMRCASSIRRRSPSRKSSTRQSRTKRRPLEGVPILLKDNIATGDAQHTTAGSLALADAQAKRDATVTRRLRDAGAVILGKANLTEFANILAIDMPAGYCSLGGQVRNPYAPDLVGKSIPLVTPGGSSAGSAVAVAAGLAAAAIGTETSGSLLSPANQNGVVTVKPTVGLISRAGIVPIAAQPGHRRSPHPHRARCRDPAQRAGGPGSRRSGDAGYCGGRRITRRCSTRTACAAPASAFRATLPIPATTSIIGPLTRRAAAVMSNVVAVLQDAGAVLVRASIPTIGWMGGPGTEVAILNRNPESPTVNQPERRPVVYLYELKHDLNAYLRDWAKGTKMQTMADIVAFNAANADRALRFGQDIFLAVGSNPRRPQRDRIRRGAADGYSCHPHAGARCLYG